MTGELLRSRDPSGLHRAARLAARTAITCLSRSLG